MLCCVLGVMLCFCLSSQTYLFLCVLFLKELMWWYLFLKSPYAGHEYALSGWSDVEFCISPTMDNLFFCSCITLHDGCLNWSISSCTIWYFSQLVCNSSLLSYHSFWKFCKTCLKLENADLRVKKTSSRGCNDWPTIMWVKPYVVTVALSFYLTCAHLLHWQNYITITTTC